MNMFHRLIAAGLLAGTCSAVEPIRVSFLWHMHQPVYFPYESPLATDAAGRFSFSVVDVHNQRLGPYTSWPRNAIQAGLGLPHLGAQVSFSGSLIENLNQLEAAGVNGGQWTGWRVPYTQAAGWFTAAGNRRLDLVAFGFHHPLMALLDETDVRMQIRLHKHVHQQTWGHSGYSRGMFPPETAFASRMIPWLASEGIEWVIVDNIHFDRACQGYPHTNASNLFAPNRADQVNPDPAMSGGAWVQLQNLWAPSPVSAPFGYRPHWIQWIDPFADPQNPQPGDVSRIIAVPAARYEGNEDGRGGFGAFLYQQVMDQYLQYNIDPDRPMLVLLHHDGDNFGGGSESYYNHNFQNFVSWISGAANYEATTVQDYLDRFPVPNDAVIHVTQGSWAGADNGDPQFKKWLGDPGSGGFSPDRNSWAVLTAAKNHVFTAEALAPVVNVGNILAGTGSNTARAWRWLLVAQASDYWYWDGTEIWDNNVTRGANQAVAYAELVTAGQPDPTPPTIFVPQRTPYNPGGFEWGPNPEPGDFEVWTYVYDLSGLQSVKLFWRIDADGFNPLDSFQNETFSGGPEVGPWQETPMAASDVPPPPGILTPVHRAQRFAAAITDQQDVLIDYYVEAIDNLGNVARSDIQHVYVGAGSGPGSANGVTVAPDPPQAGTTAVVVYNPSGRTLSGAAQVFAHVGFNNWSAIVSPDPAMTWNASENVWQVSVSIPSNAWQLDLVFNNGSGTWDNNGGADWHFTVQGGAAPGWILDGQLDPAAVAIASHAGRTLYAGVDAGVLYVATQAAGQGGDVFIYIAESPGTMIAANWAKSGQVASWDAYLANENDNNFAGWFDAAGALGAISGGPGGVLEGTLELTAEFGTIPSEICFAVGVFATQDGGMLQGQVPSPVIANGNIEAEEYLCVPLTTIGGPDCIGDADGDGQVGLGDILLILGAFGQSGAGIPGDVDGDGQVGLSDMLAVLADFGQLCS